MPTPMNRETRERYRALASELRALAILSRFPKHHDQMIVVAEFMRQEADIYFRDELQQEEV
jgi:hypothetical protein